MNLDKRDVRKALSIINQYREQLDKRNFENQKMWSLNTKHVPDYVKTDEEYNEWANKQEEEFRMLNEGFVKESRIGELLMELEEIIEGE